MGANVHAQDDKALIYAAAYGHFEVVKLLINNGADIHSRNNQALRFALEKGRKGIVELLISKGALACIENKRTQKQCIITYQQIENNEKYLECSSLVPHHVRLSAFQNWINVSNGKCVYCKSDMKKTIYVNKN
jgi:hypothetical protein